MKLSAARDTLSAGALSSGHVVPASRARSSALLRRVLWALIALALVRGFWYALIIPPWQAPDETGHFEYVWTMARLGRVPSAQDASPQFERTLVRSLYEYHHQEYNPYQVLPDTIPERISDLPGHVARARTLLWGRFSLSYLLPSFFVALVPESDMITQLYIARLSSVILNIAIIVVAFLTFQEANPDRWRYNLLAVALIALMPYHTFINSTVGDGTFAELIACCVIYFWTRLFIRGAGFWEVAGIITGLVLSLWAKATILFLIPGSLVLAAWWLISQARHQRSSRRIFAAACALLAFCVLAVALTNNPLKQYILTIWTRTRDTYSAQLQQIGDIDFYGPILHTYNSFLANFGDTAFSVSERWHIAFRLLSLAAIIGWILGRGREYPANIAIVMGVFLATALAGLVVWGMILHINYAQGRYLLPVIVPFSFLFLNGLIRLVPPQLRLRLAASLVFGMAVFDLWCIVGYIIPYFFA